MIRIPENFMGICDGRNCPSYNGMADMELCLVNCGVAHRAINTMACPKKQSKITEW